MRSSIGNVLFDLAALGCALLHRVTRTIYHTGTWSALWCCMDAEVYALKDTDMHRIVFGVDSSPLLNTGRIDALARMHQIV